MEKYSYCQDNQGDQMELPEPVPNVMDVLPGIHVEHFIDRVGENIFLLRGMCKDFLQLVVDDMAMLREEIRRKEYQEAAKRLHKMKGVAGNISAEALYNVCKEMEQSLAGEQAEIMIEQHLSVFEHELAVVVATAKRITQTAGMSNAVSVRHQHSDDIQNILHYLSIGLAAQDATSIETVMADLQAVIFSESMQPSVARLEEAIMRFDYRQAQGIVDQLVTMLKES